jgi:hypothetical protein
VMQNSQSESQNEIKYAMDTTWLSNRYTLAVPTFSVFLFLPIFYLWNLSKEKDIESYVVGLLGYIFSFHLGGM